MRGWTIGNGRQWYVTEGKKSHLNVSFRDQAFVADRYCYIRVVSFGCGLCRLYTLFDTIQIRTRNVTVFLKFTQHATRMKTESNQDATCTMLISVWLSPLELSVWA